MKFDPKTYEVGNTFVDNIILDLKKKEYDPHEKAQFIKSIMKEKNLSVRGFATRYDIAESTVANWLTPLRVSKKQYSDLRSKGFTQTEILRTLSRNKETAKRLVKMTLFECKIKNLIEELRMVRNQKHSGYENILDFLDELKKAINYFEFRYKKYKKL